MLFQLLGGKGGKAELCGQVSVGLPNEDEPVRKPTECFAEAALRWVKEGVSADTAVPKAVLFSSSLRLINMAYSFVVGLR